MRLSIPVSQGGRFTDHKKDFRKTIYLMGDHGVGKTSIIKRFVFNNFSEGIISKIMAQESLKYLKFSPLDGATPMNVRLSIKDIGNIKHPSELENVVMDDIDGILLVCDLANQDSYLSFDDWLDLIKGMPKLNSILIIGNKSDIELRKQQVEAGDLQKYADSLKTGAYVTSAKTGEGIENVFNAVVRQCMQFELGYGIMGGSAGAPASARLAGHRGRSDGRPEEPRRTEGISARTETRRPAMVDSPEELSPAQRALRELRMKHTKDRKKGKAGDYVDSSGEVHLKYGGYSYLIKEERPDKSFRAFSELIENEYEGLCIARLFPDEIKDNYEMGETPIYWLTRSGTDKNHLSVNLSRLSSFIKRFLDEHNKPALMLEGLEYLIIQNDFMSVLKFVQLVNEYTRMKRACLVVPLNPDILEERDMSLLEREMVVINAD